MAKNPISVKNPYKNMFKGDRAKILKTMHRPEGAGNFDNMDDYVLSDLPLDPRLTAGGSGDIWVKKAGDTMIGDLNMGSRNISNIRDIAVDTISTDVNYGTQKITGTGTFAWTGTGHDTFSDFNANEHFDTASLTSGSIPFSNGTTFLEDNANFFWDNSNKRQGIGTADPVYPIDIVGSTSLVTMRISSNLTANTTKFSGFVTAHYDTDEQDIALLTSLNLSTGTTLFWGGGNGALNSVSVQKFYTSPDGTTLNGTERIGITKDGLVNIGNTPPTAKFHVDQSSTTLAKPVLLLDQADVSEEFIEFISTIGTGNALEAVGAKTLTTTHFIKVTLPGGLTRYIPCGTIA